MRAVSQQITGRTRRRTGVGLCALLLMGAPVSAQAPALADLVAQAKQMVATAQAAVVASPEYKAYLQSEAYKAYTAALALQRGLEARLQAETKPEK